METYFSNINISKRHFAILGRTTDQFCNDALQLQSLEEALHEHLKEMGYQRIVFYSPTLMLYCRDVESHRHTEHSATEKNVQPPRERRIKLGPLSNRVPYLDIAPAQNKKKENKDISWNLGRMNSAVVIKIMDKYIRDISIKTALIITDTDFFITSFREIVIEGGNRSDITREVQATLSSWDTNRRYNDENIVLWIFQKGNVDDLGERLKNNDIWRRFFIPMFKEKYEKREGTLIDIPMVGSGEIKNLINYYRIKEGINVDMTLIDVAALELEKRAKGQSAFPNDKVTDMIGLSLLILGTKNKGGINARNIESICGKNDQISPFSKIDELSGMKDLKRCIDELKIQAKNFGLQNEVEIIYKNRLMRHPIDRKEELPNLHVSLVGNPGTGKSTIAKLMGGVYFELGLLPTGHVIKVTRDDLVAGYVGQTAMKTKERINEAIGGVLFIDEAYTLARGGENDYGQEAIDTILEAMTDRMGEFAVIIAGYPNEIEMLLAKNPGFKSRFLERITIADYTTKELAEIFVRDIEKNNFQLNAELRNILEGFIQRYYDNTSKGKSGEWANARTILNLSKKMRDKCKASGKIWIGIEHFPHELKKYIEEARPKPYLPKTINIHQLKLPQANILKHDNEIDIKKMEQAVLFITNTKSNGEILCGTGFLITPQGYFITCDHVIEDAHEISARIRVINNGISEDTICECKLINTSKI